MLARSLYKNKKLPLKGKRKKALFAGVIAVCLFLIIYGIYNFTKITKTAGQKEEVKVRTGDQPLQQDIVVYISADKGLSLRKERDQNSERLTVIPDKTKLNATEELDSWYKVTFDGKTGWILKQYTTQDAPAADLTAGWGAFTSPLGFKIKYPIGWKMQDYGANESTKVTSLIGFSNQDLPTTVPDGSDFVAPIILKMNSQSGDDVRKSFSTISGVTAQTITFGAYPATQYTYTSSSATQVNSIVVDSGGKVFVFSESGGYLDDLINMSKTFTIGG